ncbi:MAG: hypothetical protein JWM17_2951 [Actinobacteria bacterium]|nr:hypothetical protein [Actinomycetota bacterium]
MPYTRSFPLARWLDSRRKTIAILAQVHSQFREAEGPGRPLKIGRPVGHAYVLRVIAEFQGYARDLHDLAAETMVGLSGADDVARAMLIRGITEGRMIDRGNADLHSIGQEFRRVGIAGLNAQLSTRNAYWDRDSSRRGDRAYYQDLIELRNALAHGNQRQLDELRRRGVADTVSWARSRLPGLDRTARAMNRIVWEHFHDTFRSDPW